MASKLVMCSACNVAIRPDETVCPSCGARRKWVSAPNASGAVLLGLALAGCPSDDGTETMGSSATASSTNATTDTETGNTTSGSASMTSTSASTSDSSTTTDNESGSVSAQPPYGVPDTTSGGPDETDTETDTDTGGDTTTGG